MSDALHIPLSLLKRRAPSLADLIVDCNQIANAAPGDTNRIASLLQSMMLRYYQDVRYQALQSFWSALGAAIVGLAFFVYATAHAMSGAGQLGSIVGMMGGALSQFIAGVNFFLYFKASRQFASFHICLERTNRFLLANTMCDNLGSSARDDTRRKLIKIIATAPMLTLDTVVGRTKSPTPNGSPSLPTPS
jgi:hypothetical protein